MHIMELIILIRVGVFSVCHLLTIHLWSINTPKWHQIYIYRPSMASRYLPSGSTGDRAKSIGSSTDVCVLASSSFCPASDLLLDSCCFFSFFFNFFFWFLDNVVGYYRNGSSCLHMKGNRPTSLTLGPLGAVLTEKGVELM